MRLRSRTTGAQLEAGAGGQGAEGVPQRLGIRAVVGRRRSSRSARRGVTVSLDGGRSWKQFYDGNFDSVECAGHGRQAACWGSGAKGPWSQAGARATEFDYSAERHPYFVRVSPVADRMVSCENSNQMVATSRGY